MVTWSTWTYWEYGWQPIIDLESSVGSKDEYPTINIQNPPSALTYVLTYPFNRKSKLALKRERPNIRSMGSATLIKDLEIDPKRVGRPRLDPYQRLLGRFYEQLFLLNALGQTRDNHTTSSWELDATRARRRRFLQNLCYICEFKKGGSACTAIGLEELDTCYNFCVASNNETDKIATFLQNVLNVLRAIHSPSSWHKWYLQRIKVLSAMHWICCSAHRTGKQVSSQKRKRLSFQAEQTKCSFRCVRPFHLLI